MTIEYNNLEKALEVYAQRTVILMRNELADTQNLKNNIKVISVTANNIVMAMPEYGIYVNDGRRAGAKQPPIDALEDWAKSRNIPSEALFPIARKIARDGIEPHEFLHLLDREDELNKIIEDAMIEDIYIALNLA